MPVLSLKKSEFLSNNNTSCYQPNNSLKPLYKLISYNLTTFSLNNHQLWKRKSVEEGGADTKGLKYVIAAVVVPIGLIILAILICVLRYRSKGKKVVMAIEDVEKIKEKVATNNNHIGSLKMSNTFKRQLSQSAQNVQIGNKNIEINLVGKNDDSYYLNRKNKILEDIAKNDSASLYEELRNNNYFNNYIDIKERKRTRISMLNNEISVLNIYQPGKTTIRRRKSHEMIIVDEMEEINLEEDQSEAVSDPEIKKNKPSKRKAPRYSIYGKVEENASSSNDEFFTPENGSPEVETDQVIPSENVTNINTKNTAFHKKLIDIQKPFINESTEDSIEEKEDICPEIIPNMLNKPKNLLTNAGAFSIASDETGGSSMSNFTKNTSITVPSTSSSTGSGSGFLDRIINGDSLKRKSIPKDTIQEVSSESSSTTELANPSESVKDINKRGSFDLKLLKRTLSLTSKKSVLENLESPVNTVNSSKRDSFLDRKNSKIIYSPDSQDSHVGNDYYDKYLEEEESESDDDSDYEARRNDLVRLSINLETASGSSSDSGIVSSRSRKHAVGPTLEDLKEVEEPVNSPRPKYQMAGISDTLTSKPNFLKEGKRDSTVERSIDHNLTDTINDINQFLKENDVYTSPVILDIDNVVLGGMVITNQRGIYNINGKNFSTEEINKHFSNGSAVDVLLNNAIDESYNKSPISITSSNYDEGINNHLPSPRLGTNDNSITGVLSNVTKNELNDNHSSSENTDATGVKFEIINSPKIPKRSSKRSVSDSFNGENPVVQTTLQGINAPVISSIIKADYIEPLSTKPSGSSLRLSKALGITPIEKLRARLSSPSLKLMENEPNQTPDQIIKERFYDSEDSYIMNSLNDGGSDNPIGYKSPSLKNINDSKNSYFNANSYMV